MLLFVSLLKENRKSVGIHPHNHIVQLKGNLIAITKTYSPRYEVYFRCMGVQLTMLSGQVGIKCISSEKGGGKRIKLEVHGRRGKRPKNRMMKSIKEDLRKRQLSEENVLQDSQGS